MILLSVRCLQNCTCNDVAVIVIRMRWRVLRRSHAMSFWYRNSRSFSILSTDISRSSHRGLFDRMHRAMSNLRVYHYRAKKNAVFVCGQWIASRSFVASWKAVREARRFANGEARKAVLPTAPRSFMVQLSFHASSSSFPARIITPGTTYLRTYL